jgi:hypothetical protein
VKSELKQWLTPESSNVLHHYAEDLFRLNHFSAARQLFELLEVQIEQDNSLKSTLLGQQNFYATKQALYNLNSRLDFYGHDARWTPTFSLSTNLQRWKEDKSYFLKLFVFAHRLRQLSHSQEEQIVQLDEVATTSMQRVESLTAQQQELIEQLPNIKMELESIERQEQELRQELVEVEADIRRRAADDFASSSLLKAVRSLGAIISVIPAGQPAFAAIGAGMTTIANIAESDQPLVDIFHQLPRMSKLFDADMLERSAKDWNRKWSQVSASRFAELDSLEDKVGYARDVVEFSSPIVKEVQKQINLLNQQEVPRSELERKINEIKNSDPRFNSLISSLRQLLNRKMQVVKEIRAFEASLLSIGKELHEAVENYILTRQQIAKLQSGVGKHEEVMAMQLEQEAKRGLAYGIYLLERSFATAFATPLDLSREFDAFIQGLMSKISNVEGDTLAQEEILNIFYDREVEQLKTKILEQLTGRTPKSRVFRFTLNRAELSELNRSGSVLFSTLDERVGLKNFENIHLASIQLDKVAGTFGEQDEIIIERIGGYYLSRNEQTFALSSNQETEMTSFYYRADRAEFVESTIDSQVTNLLATLFNLSREEQQLIYERPGVKAIYRVTLKGSDKLKLNSLGLLFNCSVVRK